MHALPIAEGLFTWPAAEPQLIGSACTNCGVITFPAQASCPKCTGEDVEARLLSRRGVLWTWTIQGFRPKSPPYTGADPFVPYGVGYVELPGEVRVETRLTTNDPDELRIGREMELTIVPFRTEPDGTEVVTFAFRPV
jgi:uncharacterized OB-fold protein